LITTSQIKDNVTETLTLKFHQKLDGIAAGTARKTIIKLFRRRNSHGRLVVVVKRADAHEFTTFFLENNMFSDHIDNVGAFLDSVDRAWMKAGAGHHGSLIDEWRSVQMNSV